MSTSSPSWQAKLSLGFAQRSGKTVLAERQQLGPLTVQRAFYPEGDLAHLYILHPPGGVVGGDDLHITAYCADYAQALLTTPAAGKFYRSAGAWARQRITLRVGEHASLEWLPQETLLFGGAQVDLQTQVELGNNSHFIGWDMLCLGMPESQDSFEQGAARLKLRIHLENQPVLIENLNADHAFAQAAWGLRGNPVLGVFYAYPFPKADLAAVQALWEAQTGFAATWLDGLLVCRGIAPQAAAMRTEFERVWRLTRPLAIGRPACSPRI
ncbi:MAG: urease accessory protein UreD, partial [Candidatus Methylumidiphilus sp.]